MKYTVIVPDSLNAFDRDAVGKKLIRTIKERTEKGIDVDGKAFAPYSESYVNSLPFKIAGKSPSKVNLRLSDEMMESIEVIDSGTGFITLGFTNPSADQKAEWNAATDNGPSREFLGLTLEEIDSALVDYLPTQPTEETTVDSSLTDRILEAARQRILNEDN